MNVTERDWNELLVASKLTLVAIDEVINQAILEERYIELIPIKNAAEQMRSTIKKIEDISKR